MEEIRGAKWPGPFRASQTGVVNGVEPPTKEAGWPAAAVSPVAFICLVFFVVCVVNVQGRQPLWNSDLGADVGEYYRRAHDYLAGRLRGDEYPPFAIFLFLVPALFEKLGVPFQDTVYSINMFLASMHLALLNQIAGRTPTLLMAAFLLAAGPIVLFRFELFVSLLVLLVWQAWKSRMPRMAGALLAMAILTKLYPIVLLPLVLRAPDDRWQAKPVLQGLLVVTFLTLCIYCVGGGSISDMNGMLRFHEQKPVALESTQAVVVMAGTYLRGAWPPHTVNEYGIHGLALPWPARVFPGLGFIGTLVLIYVCLWRRNFKDGSSRFIFGAFALLMSFIFWSTLFQPQYMLWPLAFVALLPTTGMAPRRVLRFGALFVVALGVEQIIFPCHYPQFLDIFYRGGPPGILFLALAVTKTALSIAFVLAVREVMRADGAVAGAKENGDDARISAGKRE